MEWNKIVATGTQFRWENEVNQRPEVSLATRTECIFPVKLSAEHSIALVKLGGYVDTHVARAVDLYLETLGIPQEEEDEDEYFDPDTFIDD
jgi:hypothetical protein